MTSRTLSPDLIASITSVDPRSTGRPLPVKEIWRVDIRNDHSHFVFIGDRGRAPYCDQAGYDCCCVAAVLQKRAAGVLADQP